MSLFSDRGRSVEPALDLECLFAGEFGREEGAVSEEELVRVDRTEREDDDSEK